MSGESSQAPRRAFVRRQFVARHVAIAAGTELAFTAADWRDAIVVVEQGSVEVESLDGDRATFATGAMLCLDGLSMGTLRNRGPESVQLYALSRPPPLHLENDRGRHR
jgi:hypothetical protein